MNQPGCRWSLGQCALHILELDGLPAPEWPAHSRDSAWRSTSPIGRCLAPQVEDMGQGEYQHTWQQYINAFAEALIAAGADDPQSPAGRRVVSVTVLSEARQHASTRCTGFHIADASQVRARVAIGVRRASASGAMWQECIEGPAAWPPLHVRQGAGRHEGRRSRQLHRLRAALSRCRRPCCRRPSASSAPWC